MCVREEEQKLKDRLYKLMMTDGNDGQQTAGPFEENTNKGDNPFLLQEHTKVEGKQIVSFYMYAIEGNQTKRKR